MTIDDHLYRGRTYIFEFDDFYDILWPVTTTDSSDESVSSLGPTVRLPIPAASHVCREARGEVARHLDFETTELRSPGPAGIPRTINVPIRAYKPEVDTMFVSAADVEGFVRATRKAAALGHQYFETVKYVAMTPLAVLNEFQDYEPVEGLVNLAGLRRLHFVLDHGWVDSTTDTKSAPARYEDIEELMEGSFDDRASGTLEGGELVVGEHMQPDLRAETFLERTREMFLPELAHKQRLVDPATKGLLFEMGVSIIRHDSSPEFIVTERLPLGPDEMFQARYEIER
ncbi:hypothetical protein GGTG_08727 [Gaeumannomyces tritici R3-111a-1]|uniref:Uncharacterized protein n=1 Tax=Gaeumannomyces tritici (strain R3-111a-1) TaxID=644352 RepID=J3P5D8_GAET3|nr:hypothetical protein GGTG_08727 [Gaeumannomyces tritici R3-111a-1]EJT74889.1 hypothetical protein GGTG_08727 [Gaeumannomyces tritici R3-111a-1]